MGRAADLPQLTVADAAAWRAWLDEHEASADGVWLVLAKKGTTQPTSLRYDEALDEALCSGWIDGQVNRLDDAVYRQRFTPRRARSRWSARNVEHVARLEADGRMRPRGRAEVQRALEDGRWDAAYAGPATIAVPTELREALAHSPVATAAFAALDAQNRYAILLRTSTGKRPETRRRNAARFVAMLERGETPYPR